MTISTVARRAGRSISTVSAALNGGPGVSEATRGEILAIAHELGYVADPAARLLRARRTGVIGVSYMPGQAFQVALVDGLYAAAARHSHTLSLAAATPRHGERQGVEELVRGRCEGIVVVDSRIGVTELTQASGGLPLLALCRESRAPGVDIVRSDDAHGVTALVDHLVSGGRSDLVYVDGADAPSSDIRVAAFRRAAAGPGAAGRVVPGGDDEAAGVAAVEGLARAGDLPQALLCFNDHVAIGAVLELRRRGLRVPEDVAVAGFDGIALAGLSALDLTTVRQEVDVITELAVRHLAGRLACGTGAPVTGLPPGVRREERAGGASAFIVLPRLVVRGSTA
ncbi:MULTISPECIES: LacI family DNA-binding transcriptional regulator [unclassified Actinomyces]|uniref:LacI family DNA-binding transcriptional regulator n=1 Tax=unclassified Actinomyces TaxID=2609248 RepID=UPI0020179387|nr:MULTISPECIES: LacI family DNA-binding transcriptional regulator [unclassified Actinomyces]